PINYNCPDLHATITHSTATTPPPPTPPPSPLSLHDALPILLSDCVVYPSPGDSPLDFLPYAASGKPQPGAFRLGPTPGLGLAGGDRKSTRLNSSHGSISYAVFCLIKNNKYTLILHSYNQ